MIAGKRRFVAGALDRRPLRRLAAWDGVLTLNYHRVGDASHADTDRSLWSASAEGFDAHLAELTRHCDVIGPQDLPDVLARGTGRHALLTFDDGYRDNFEIAYPLLRAYGLSATFFVTTGYLDRPRAAWWDELAWMVRHGDTPPSDPEPVIRSLTLEYKALSSSETGRFLDAVAERTGAGRCPAEVGAEAWMTWEMVREMRDGGMTIGGHTVDHPVLSSLAPFDQHRQIVGCALRLREELGQRMRWFAYPVGSRAAFTPATMRILAAQGVTTAFSFYGGHQPAGAWEPLDVPRAHVGPACDARMLRAMLSFPQLFARAA